jgi:hypothetical protein
MARQRRSDARKTGSLRIWNEGRFAADPTPALP